MRYIYADYAATTPLETSVLAKMTNFLSLYGNPSAVYDLGVEAKAEIERARVKIADLINAEPDEIYFTSGGTEADNWVLKMCPKVSNVKHIITSKIEHHAILNTCKWLESQGVKVTYIGVDHDGRVNPADVEAAILPETCLISIMTANNEMGTIQPIREIGEIAKKHHVLFHTDAVQAYGHIPIDVKKDNVDFLSASAHKIYGPKGVGFLYIKKPLKLEPLIHGGGQERGLRASTENTLGIIGFGEAAEIARQYLGNGDEKMLCDYLLRMIREKIPGVMLNGDPVNRLPNNLNITFEGVPGEVLQRLLSDSGICVSTGSACNSGNGEVSHVLKAIGLSDEEANSSIRITLSRFNTYNELNYIVDTLVQIVGQLRRVYE